MITHERAYRNGAWWRVRMVAAALLLTVFPAAMQPQTAATASAPAQNAPEPPTASEPAKSGEATTSSARRRANKLYLAASKLYISGQFEEALKTYEQATRLDPGNETYSMAADVARSHLVTALIQQAAKSRLGGDEAGAETALRRALALDPRNPAVTQHLYELSDAVAREQTEPLYQQAASTAGEGVSLRVDPGRHSLHLHSDQRQLIQQVFKMFGITALITDSVPPTSVRFDLDDADFHAAMRALSLTTGTFYVPLDTHQVVVARDTRDNRTQFLREDLETVYLSGLSNTELTEAGNLAKNVFNVQQVATNTADSSLTLRGTPTSLEAFNASMRGLLEGHNQVMLDVRILQVAHTTERNTGVQPPQSISGFNVYAEEQSLLNANQTLVQEIISSGLASADDPLAIIGILLASGEVSSSLFSGGLALFGGGLTESGLSPSGPATMYLNLNSSESRLLDNIQLRLGDGETGTIKEGTKYPIQTSSYSSLSSSASSIAGLTSAGTSSSLSSLLASLSGSSTTIPMIQYQDLGLTLKVTANVLRDGEVALSADLTMDGLAGTSLNGNPILNHQLFSGVVTIKEGEAAEIASQMNQSISRAISGTPGLGDVPGLNNAMDKDVQKNYATLLIIMTPHVVHSTQPAGQSQQMVVEKGLTTP